MTQRDRIIETSSKVQQPKEDKKLKTFQTEVSEIKTAIPEMKAALDKDGPASIMSTSIGKEPTLIMSTSIGKEPTLQQRFKQEQKPPEPIRIRGVPESISKIARESNEHDMRKVTKMLQFLSVGSRINEIKRLGPYQE